MRRAQHLLSAERGHTLPAPQDAVHVALTANLGSEIPSSPIRSTIQCVIAVLLFLIPYPSYAKEHGTVVDIWEQRDFYACHYIYQVETETHVYEFLGHSPQTFQQGDTLTFTLDKDLAPGKRV
jgi:hypothetical protein